jgi:hypothetical protein
VTEQYKNTKVTANVSEELQPPSEKEVYMQIMQTDAFKRKLPGIPAYESDNEEDDEVEPYLKKVKMMQSCDTCGLVFKDGGDLQRHVRSKTCEEGNEDPSPDLENEGIRIMAEREFDINRDYFENKRKRYEEKNMSHDAIEKNMKTLQWKLFKDTYSRFLTYMHYFDKGPNTRKIIQSVDCNRDVRPQIRSKLNHYRSWISEYLDEVDDDDTDDDSSIDEDDEEK